VLDVDIDDEQWYADDIIIVILIISCKFIYKQQKNNAIYKFCYGMIWKEGLLAILPLTKASGLGLFLGIWNWGYRQLLGGGGRKHAQSQIYIKKHIEKKTEQITLNCVWGVSSLNWEGGSPPPWYDGCDNARV